jgi:hypothetical protein
MLPMTKEVPVGCFSGPPPLIDSVDRAFAVMEIEAVE